MSFKIQLTPGPRTFEANPGETLLDAALRQGVDLPYGCRNGRCGSCAVKLLGGSIGYPSGLIEGLEGKVAGTCLTCQAVAQSDLGIEVSPRQPAAASEIRTLPCRLERKERLVPGILRLWLKLPEQQRLGCMPGQSARLLLKDGRQRTYAIASPPSQEPSIELHLRLGGGDTIAELLCDGLAEGSLLRIQGPLGTPGPREDLAQPMILIGEDTGFAPLKAVIEHAIARGDARPIHLYLSARSRRDLYLPELPARWREQHADFRFTPVLAEPDADWTGRVGPIQRVVIEDTPDLVGRIIHISGTMATIAACRDAFASKGANPDGMFFNPLDATFDDAITGA